MMTQSNLTFKENQAIPEGYKKTEVGVIPNDWEVLSINDFAIKVGSGKTPKGGAQIYKKSGYPFVRSQNIGWGILELSDVVYISKEIHENFHGNDLKNDDVLLNITGASIGRCAKADYRISGGNVNQHVCIIRSNTDTVNSDLLVEIINSKIVQTQINSYQAGGNREGLNFSQVRQLQIPMPKKAEEQLKIALVLNDVNGLISELEKLIEKKQAIKTATMQQLLTGKTRLPEFALREDGTSKGYKDSELGQIPEDWEVFNLPDVIWYQEGPGLRKWQFQTKGLKVINVTNLQESGYLDLDKTSRHISWDEFEKMYQHFACDEGDMVIASSGNSYCKTSIVRSVDLPLLMNTSVIRFKPLKSFSQAFMYIYLSSKFFKSQIDLLITGGAQPNFGPAHLEKIKIIAPENVEEQSQIGERLLDLENEIKALEIKLNKIKSIKQGMMQELLTGKTRLV
jgi:type I restriction enzyme S subunit